PHLSKEQTEEMLKKEFGVEQILWLNHGYLAGDDTDSHIDTLARFIDTDTIMYVKCDDAEDEHYEALQKMEAELKQLRDPDGEPFRLVPLPMCSPAHYDGERLPATYANFLIINGAVLLPVYNDPHDAEAIEICRKAFKGRDIVPIDCSVLIRQHGSLHCVTMQFPEEVSIRV
ncbi:MAG: agmatine deiminase family protein, partial [Campylobacterales bacterium]|nr:agmatine deiminase family protein [Campylobacterales bacterium]